MTDQQLKRVRETAREATTEDLLDRVTVYRGGMEPDAVRVLEEELASRGFGPAELGRHQQENEEVLYDEDGVALKCSYCDRPAVGREEECYSGLAGIVT